MKSFESKSCTISIAHVHEGCEESEKDNERKETEKEYECLQPKKHMPMKHLNEARGRKEHKSEKNDEHKELLNDEEKEGDEECHKT